MKIKHTEWKTIAEENQFGGGLTFGYEAPASEALLRKVQGYGVGVEVRGKNANSFRLIQPDNKDPQVFTEDKKFRIISKNAKFKQFETYLTEASGEELPEGRFDEFMDWTNANVWEKQGVGDLRGYRLNLGSLSSSKQDELKENLKGYGPLKKGNKLYVTDPTQVKTLEFTWRVVEAKKQRTKVQGKSK